MEEKRNDLVKEVFQEALEKPEAERPAFVESACDGDERIRERVLALLAAHPGTEGFLGSPIRAVGGGARPEEAGTAGSFGYVGTTIGRYKVLQLIGEGGFGAVYMAEQLEPIRRRVALKLIKLGMDTRQVVARFEAERQALAMMEHPNIARVLDAGATDSGRPYFVMELVKGVPITEYCDEKCLSTYERLELFKDVCAAVQHAHQKGVVHRDLKPSNVLIAQQDGRPVPKVIDFGVARATGQQLTDKTLFTAFGQFIGTPLYMSPEQAETSGADVDTRSDIYSLGVLLYELLTGTTPFTSGQIRNVAHAEVLRVLRQVDPPPPSTRVSQLGESGEATARLRSSEPNRLQKLLRGDLDWIVMKALEKDRSRRYASASELAVDLERYFVGDPVSAGPPELGYRLRKIVRRNRGKATAAAAVVAAVVVGGTAAGWQAVRASAAAERARANTVFTHAATTEDPLLKALLIDEIADVPDLPGKLAVLREAANHPLPIRVIHGPDYANDADYSPDGRYFVASFRDGTARVWRTDGTGDPLILDHGVEVDHVSFSPDGDQILTGSTDGIVRLWPLAGGDPLVFTADLRIEGAGFSPDGKRISASTEQGGPVWIWQADGTGEPVVIELEGTPLVGGQFFPDGEHVLSPGTDGVVRIWRVDGSGPTAAFPSGTDNWVYAGISPDGKRVIVEGDGGARVYATDGSMEPLVLEHAGAVSWATGFSGELATTSSRDGTVKIWHLDRPEEPITLRHAIDRIERSVGDEPDAIFSTTPAGALAKISRDGSRIFTATIDGTIRLWSTEGLGPEATFTGPGRGLLDESPDGSEITATFSDGTLRTWSLRNAATEAVTLPHEDIVDEVVFSPDGRHLATASADGLVRIWSGDGTVGPISLRGHADWVTAVRFSPHGRRIVSASVDGTARIWMLDGSQPPIILDHGSPVPDAAFSPDGRQVVTGSRDDGRVLLWSSDGGGDPVLVTEHLDRVRSVSFSPDGSRVLSASFDQWARITPVERPGDAVRMRGNYYIWDAEFSADGEWVVLGSDGGDVRVISADGGPARVLRGEGETVVRSVAFSPNGDRVVAGTDDGTIRIWRLDGTEEAIELTGHTAPVTGVAFSPDGKRVATSSVDGTVRIWRVTWDDLLEYVRSNLHACLTPEQRMNYLAESERAARAESAACQRRLGRAGGTTEQ